MRARALGVCVCVAGPMSAELAHSPATCIDIVRRRCRSAARQFSFKRLFQPEINYRKYLDLCIVRTPDFRSNFMVKKCVLYSKFYGTTSYRLSVLTFALGCTVLPQYITSQMTDR